MEIGLDSKPIERGSTPRHRPIPLLLTTVTRTPPDRKIRARNRMARAPKTSVCGINAAPPLSLSPRTKLSREEGFGFVFDTEMIGNGPIDTETVHEPLTVSGMNTESAVMMAENRRRGSTSHKTDPVNDDVGEFLERLSNEIHLNNERDTHHSGFSNIRTQLAASFSRSRTLRIGRSLYFSFSVRGRMLASQ